MPKLKKRGESKYAVLLFVNCKKAIAVIVELAPALEKMLARHVIVKGAEVFLICIGEFDNMHSDVHSWAEILVLKRHQHRTSVALALAVVLQSVL